MQSSEMERGMELIEGIDIPQEAKDELLSMLTWNELNKDEYEDNDLFDAHKFHEELGFVPGAYVKLTYSAEVGRIVNYNHSKGMNSGVRYPLKIKFQRGTFEWGIFSIDYEEVRGYKEKYGNVEEAMNQIEESPTLELVDTEEAELIIDIQKIIKDMTLDELWDFQESGEVMEIELPHIQEFVEEELEKRTRPIKMVTITEG